ncbi:MAG: energy transducer TonB [Acidobacteriaceae bacterium]|nr:energy transducer TonB [Acidobacteriaceae bacterium]
MFDALLESTGSLKTQSKYWTIATFGLNAGFVAVLVLIPLLYPEALPHPAISAMLLAPPPPPAPPSMAKEAATSHSAASQGSGRLTAPTTMPTKIRYTVDTTIAPAGNVRFGDSAGPGSGVPGADLQAMIGPPPVIVVTPRPPRSTVPVRVSTGVATGNLIVKTQPVYPAIARAAHVSGTVVLRAVISKSGSIENLAVESGPAMLRQAALDGVRTWRYRPFLLNGEQTEVDTTIQVNFTTTE